MPRQQPETALRARIVLALRAAGCFVFKVHGSPYQMAGMPDLYVAGCGRSGWMEVKAGDGRLSRVQEHVIDVLRGHGLSVGVVRSVEDARRLALEWKLCAS